MAAPSQSKRRTPTRLILTAVAAGLLPLGHGHASHSGLPSDAPVGSEGESPAFMNNSTISSRFEQLYEAGLHAPPLQVDEAALPHEINATLRAHALAWRDLSGTLQRLLLWDAGFVATPRLELARVFVECGLSMDDAVVPRDQFLAQGCASRLCNNKTRTAAGEPTCTALRVKCAVNGLEGEASAPVALWSEEEPNDDIPRPTIFRIANQSYAIHMHDSSSKARVEGCPTQLRLAIPCTHVHSDVAEWCVPKPSGVVSSLLETLRPSTAVRADAPGKSPNVLMPILWLSVMCITGVVSIVFLLSQRKVKAATRSIDQAMNAKQVGAPATTVTSESELDFISICSNAGTIGEPIDKTTRSLGGLSSINGSSSYNDLVNASEVLLAFQTDPLIIQKRIPMVDIEFTRRLCHGASGDVFIGRVHGQRVAVKQLLQLKRNEIDDLECFAREIQLTATLDHPNIIKMVGVAWNSLQNMALVLEYRSGGDLLNAIRKRGSRWSWNGEKLQVAMGVAKAMVYLHSRTHPLVHRDIKSRNILIDASTIEPALCDFGSSRNVSALDLLSTDPAGTILWSAPEVICSQNYTVKADIFSYGVVLAELDTCALPYTEERDSEGRAIQAIRIAHMVVENRVKPQLSEHCPRFIRELVVKCVKHKPESRPTAEEVLARLTEAANDCAALWKSKPSGPHSM